MRLLTFLTTLVLVAQTPPSVFEIELWPGEGRPQFQAVATALAIRETPSMSATITRRLAVTKGQQIRFDETRFLTIESGEFEVLSATTLTGRSLGNTRFLSREAYYRGPFPFAEVPLKDGERIEYLQYRAEGTCFVRVGADVIDATPCPTQDERTFRVLGEPKTEWWIRIVVGGVPTGWVMVEQATIQVSGRSF